MKMRLIDADKLLEELKSKLPIMSNWGEAFVPDLIWRQPTVDAEAIVRCEDCLYWVPGANECESWEWCKMLNTDVPADGFCIYGARKKDSNVK